jgi:hypothetical protein
MRNNTLRAVSTVLAVTTLLLACAKPRPAPPPMAAAVDAGPPEPPPPPKCEALGEGCTAKEDTRAAIAGTKLAFRPPAGWTWATEADATVAEKGKAAIVVIAKPITDKKKPPRAAAFDAVVARLAVTMPKGKGKGKPKAAGKPSLPKKPDRKMVVGGAPMELFQLEAVERDGAKGPLLVFATRQGDEAVVVGAAFVPEDDASKSDAEVMSAIESLAPAESPP